MKKRNKDIGFFKGTNFSYKLFHKIILKTLSKDRGIDITYELFNKLCDFIILLGYDELMKLLDEYINKAKERKLCESSKPSQS